MINRLTILLLWIIFLCSNSLSAQNAFKLKFKNSSLYAGIDIGSKGVKMSVLEVGKNAQKTGAFNTLQETSINTDFISFTRPTFTATLDGLTKLYSTAVNEYKIPSNKIFTVISSGAKGQADKDGKNDMIKELIDSFRVRINDASRQVSVVDVVQEARLSHLGIVPDDKRFSTFLIDIGSGNTKGGYFPNGNINDFKLFGVSWGTRSVANATDKRLGDDKSLTNYTRQLTRVLAGEPDAEIIYAVNASGAYSMSDNIAVSGGIAWATATLMYPEMLDNPVVPVTYTEVAKFHEKLVNNFKSISDSAFILRSISDNTVDKAAAVKAAKNVLQVFDQRSMIAGTGLLLKIMRQFESLYEKKQFYLVKNGQVGWITAYVESTIK